MVLEDDQWGTAMGDVVPFSTGPVVVDDSDVTRKALILAGLECMKLCAIEGSTIFADPLDRIRALAAVSMLERFCSEPFPYEIRTEGIECVPWVQNSRC